jgi:hypothetical protein
MDDISDKLHSILKRISAACVASNRDPEAVRLLLATKTVSAERIRMALHAGQTLIGENKVQEIKEKYEALREMPHETHFIGHLQSNKIKEILRYGVSCIQSLDRLDLAEKLHQRLSQENKKIDVLVQVNTSNEESKFGVHPDDAIELVRAISTFDTINIKGLMTIGLFSAETAKVRQCFKLLKSIRDRIADLQIPNVAMKELSMGMSGDLETAIEEGATIVRVGTAIFGQRAYPDSYYWNEKETL